MRLFTWIRRHRATINGILITVFTSLIFNAISDNHGNLFSEFGDIFPQIIDINSLGGILIIVSLFFLVVFNLTFVIVSRQLNKRSFSKEFPDLMKRFTSPRVSDSMGKGCLGWGEGKTVEICNDIIFGWNPNNIIVENYENEMYRFYAEEDRIKKFGEKSYYFNESDWLEFKNTDKFKAIIKKGNNLPRFMLKDCSKNYDKKDRKLLISLGRTEWSQTSYVWDRFGKSKGSEVDSNELMYEYSRGITSGNESEPYIPNSFCMHLLIGTLDNRVVLSRISQAKVNDNPGTWAATLGEQLDLEDFTDGNNFFDDFVMRWMKRAFLEEYKFDENVFNDAVDEETLKIISVNFESDRYNFSLFCTVQLRYTFDTFNKKIAPTLATEEAIEVKGIAINEIPDILMTYEDEIKRKEYHPSTYLRLLLFFMHKNGYSKSERILLKKAKDLSKKRTGRNDECNS